MSASPKKASSRPKQVSKLHYATRPEVYHLELSDFENGDLVRVGGKFDGTVSGKLNGKVNVRLASGHIVGFLPGSLTIVSKAEKEEEPPS